MTGVTYAGSSKRHERAGGRVHGLPVDRAIARGPAVGRTELARAFLARKSGAGRISTSFPASVGLMGQVLLDIRQTRRTASSIPNSKPGFPAGVSTDLDALFRNQIYISVRGKKQYPY